jgi:hypothetical protein
MVNEACSAPDRSEDPVEEARFVVSDTVALLIWIEPLSFGRRTCDRI